jgi:hypothetical protein
VKEDMLVSIKASEELQELHIHPSAMLAHTIHYGGSLRVADAGRDQVLRARARERERKREREKERKRERERERDRETYRRLGW